MAGNIKDKANSMFASVGAVQTLVENFPMNLISFGNLNYSSSFDVLAILLKLIGITNEELIEKISQVLAPNENDEEGAGFIAYAEEVVKVALEANIMNLLNCSTNPVISNKLLDSYYTGTDIEESGEGIILDVSEVDFTGVLNRNPFMKKDSKFYFDVEDYNASTVWKSKDFNAFLWYIINKSDKLQTEERTWVDRYKALLWDNGNNKEKGKKEIIRCTYIDGEYPMNDKIQVQICGSRNKEPANYFKTRKIKVGKKELEYNKTIFEFNHEFLTSIKLYDAKVIVAEIIEYLLGDGNMSINIGLNWNENVIQKKIDNLIEKVITQNDLEVEDCYFTFSNDEYNDMLEQAERNRYNIHKIGDTFKKVDTTDILNQLNGITNQSTLNEDIATIQRTITAATGEMGSNGSNIASGELKISYDFKFELMRMLVYPFVRPLFTPKVIFLLLVNKKIMGSLEDANTETLVEDLTNGLLWIVKDIIVQLKNMLIDMFLSWILQKLTPLLALFAARILLEALQMYKDLLLEIFSGCGLSGWNMFGLNGSDNQLDNVNYADIEPETESTEPNQKLC